MLSIKAENISKQYRLGEVGTGTLSHDLNRFWHKIRGNEDPYLKIGEVNDRSVKGVSDYVWPLKDINFEIEQGDAVGIIGRNGAGKSTLLKLLSKVTKPTTGSFKVNGRIASLLEVGTGFNPEMTGRENIYLNGAILGMRRYEISRKLDEIIEFSGVERYIDTPVKRYSSGMYVRLAFAVAAHLESEILIVDEVLAVGDAEFQKKCLGKMGDVSNEEGRTVLFVSHNMESISALCNKSILLKEGLLNFKGNTNEAINLYNNNSDELILNSKIKLNFSEFSDFKLTYLLLKTNETHLGCGDNIVFEIGYSFNNIVKKPQFCIIVEDSLNSLVTTLISDYQTENNELNDLIGDGKVNCHISNLYLMPGIYNISLKLWTPGELLYSSLNIGSLNISSIGSQFNVNSKYSSSFGNLYIPAVWKK
jgi:lipopolysaccharide transport system ATP-binding protein